VIFLKLGGSLITDKAALQTPRLEVISRIAEEIKGAYEAIPDLKLLIGHGSGSFGHPVADRFQTQRGASSPEDWLGFVEVWKVANRLNRLVIDGLLQAGLPVLSFPPSASAISEGGYIRDMAVEPLRKALLAGLFPVVQGDVAFDEVQGSTILSTERVFEYLAPFLKPGLVLLAGLEPGVFASYKDKGHIIPRITLDNIDHFEIAASATVDVTGGMHAKVRQALSLCQMIPGLEVRIFSGETEGLLRDALVGEPVGTLITEL
jgi:isopentenyl phosphate kinase